MNDELKAKIVVRIITAILAFIAFLVAWDGMLSVSMATKGYHILDMNGDLDDTEHSDEEFDYDNTLMECSECHHEAHMDDFDTDNQADDDEEDEEEHKPQNPDDIP